MEYAQVLNKSVKRILAVLSLLYVSVCGYFYLQQDSLIFAGIGPRLAEQQEAFAYGAKPFAWKNPEGHKLEGFFIPGDSSKPLVFYFGGNADNVWGVVPVLQPSGATLYSLNYPSFGQSEGNPSESVIIRDAKLWTQKVQAQYPHKKVILIGRSLGTGVAVQVASVFPQAKVVLITPYESLRAVAQARFPWLPISVLLKHPFASVEYAPALRNPLYMILTEQDHLIPHAHSQTLYNAWRGPKQQKMIADATHNNLFSYPETYRVWLEAGAWWP